jgi:hypothetical protein
MTTATQQTLPPKKFFHCQIGFTSSNGPDAFSTWSWNALADDEEQAKSFALADHAAAHSGQKGERVVRFIEEQPRYLVCACVGFNFLAGPHPHRNVRWVVDRSNQQLIDAQTQRRNVNSDGDIWVELDAGGAVELAEHMVSQRYIEDYEDFSYSALQDTIPVWARERLQVGVTKELQPPVTKVSDEALTLSALTAVIESMGALAPREGPQRKYLEDQLRVALSRVRTDCEIFLLPDEKTALTEALARTRGKGAVREWGTKTGTEGLREWATHTAIEGYFSLGDATDEELVVLIAHEDWSVAELGMLFTVAENRLEEALLPALLHEKSLEIIGRFPCETLQESLRAAQDAETQLEALLNTSPSSQTQV